MIVLRVADRPGVLAAIATVVAEHGVSIEAMRQVPLPEDSAVYEVHAAEGVPGYPGAEGPAESLLRITTHPARERALASTVTAIKELDAVTDVVSVLRVEGN